MSDVAGIARKMLAFQFCPGKELYDDISSCILNAQCFFVVPRPGTSDSDWTAHNYGPFTDASGNMVCFLSLVDASRFATQNGLCIGPEPMVASVPREQFLETAAKCCDEGLSQKVRVYAAPPVSFLCGIPELLAAAGPAPSVAVPRKFLGVDKVREVLETFDAAERRKLDPSGHFENAHQTIEFLTSRNKIDPSVLDSQLNFAPGFTQNFCTDIVDSSINKSGLQGLLGFFGLERYLYLYRRDCLELQRELKDNQNIDQYSLRNVRVSTKEPFELVKIQRGLDENNNTYIYGLTLQSKYRKQRFVLSSPFGCVVGKSYEIEGLKAIVEENNPQGVTKAYSVVDIDENPDKKSEDGKTESRKEEGLLRPSKPGRTLKGSAQEQRERQDFVIGYFKKTDGINYAAAVEKYRVLVEDPDVLDAYYSYLKTKKHGWLVRNSVTPEMLVRDYHYPPYEAYCIMIRMQDDPSGTMTMLKHRKNEPQYQKKRSGDS